MMNILVTFLAGVSSFFSGLLGFSIQDLQVEHVSSIVTTKSLLETKTQDDKNVREYVSQDFSFKFTYPNIFPEMKDSKEKKCKAGESWNGETIQKLIVAESDNLSVSVVCEKLDTSLLQQFMQEGAYEQTEVYLSGTKSYTHYFVTSTGYEWRVLQVPLNEKKYIEVAYSYRDLPDYQELSDKEWKSLVESFTIK